MTAEQKYLRPDLRANLLDMLRQNRRHEDIGMRLFELGKVFLPRANDLPEEPEMLCGLLNGLRSEKSWLTAEEPFDFFDARGTAQALMGKLGVEATFEAGDDAGLHPARQSVIVIGDKRIGVVGELHPGVAHDFEFTQPVYLFELNVDALVPFATSLRMYQPVPRYPSTIRDIAVVVDAKVTHRSIESIIRSFSLVTEVGLFDVYSGEQVPAGKKSLAYRITYQAPDHTLTDDEVSKVHQQILDRLSAELGAILRS